MKRRIFITSLLLACMYNASQGQKQSPKLTVYIFLSPECPLSQNYTKTLNTLNDEYGKQVRFIGVIPGKSYSSSEIKNYVSDYKIKFRIIKDRDRSVVAKMNATVTPEVVLTNQERHILYRGAIDDWAISPGKKKLSPTISYLKNAIEQTLNGADVVVRSTKPVGCLINDF